MKKVSFLLPLLACAAIVPAQTNTTFLQWGQREPTFYYWDCQYADCNYYAAGYSNYTGSSRIIARYCYIDTSLKVIGIAAPATVLIPRDQFLFVDSNRKPEFFQLYEATDTSFELVAEARYDTATPRYNMILPNMNNRYDPYDIYRPVSSRPGVYEAYFEKPVVVRDSFYVGVTNWNNDPYYNDSTDEYEMSHHYFTTYYEIGVGDGNDYSFDLFKIRYTNPYDRCRHHTSRTRTMQNLYHRGWIYVSAMNSAMPEFMPIFPIFDTTGLDIHGYRWIGECDTVRGLRFLRFENNRIYISWNNSSTARWWEYAYGPAGTPPENCTRDTAYSTLLRLNPSFRNMLPGSTYTLYVRERCRDDTRGPWSAITFSVPDSAVNGLVPQPSPVDRHTHIMPNPASGPVTVFSSFRISSIEVYSTAGTLVETVHVNANTGVIDASNWPHGAYILRISTSQGDTAKRLVKP